MKKNKKDISFMELTEKEREDAWDTLYATEEGLILEFDQTQGIGKIKSLADGGIYKIDGRELNRIKLELRPGDKVLFAPIEDMDGDDYARIIKIISLND